MSNQVRRSDFIYTGKPPRRNLKVAFVAMGLTAAVGAYFISRNLPARLPGLPFTRPEPVGGKLVDRPIHTASYTIEQVNAEAKVVYNVPDLPAAKTGVEQYSVTYTSEDPRDGKELRVKARFYLPLVASGAPVLGFGPGTTGPGSVCAPSLEAVRAKNWGQYDKHMLFYAGQGYAVAITDYEGRGEGQIHHYFIGETEGRSMLDMVRALKKFKDGTRFKSSPAGEDVFLAGYSQGGHAALWADQIAPQYAPEVKVKGVVGYVAATDITRMWVDTASGAASNWIPPWVYASYDDYYDLRLPASELFKEPFATNVSQDARRVCIDEAGGIQNGHYGLRGNLGLVYQQPLIDSLKNGTFSTKYPELANHFNQNLAGKVYTPTPKLIIGGDKDLVIFPAAQTDLMRRLCSDSRARAQLMMGPGVTHYTAMAYGRARTIEWMKQISAGQQVTSDCALYR
jgi:pimeloyl-ACP methyl ester carboxylesterase